MSAAEAAGVGTDMLARNERWWLVVGAFAVGAGAALWSSLHELPWMGPLLADNLRRLLGAGAVTRIEETVADVEDHVHQAVSGDEVRGLRESTPSDLLSATEARASAVVTGRRPADFAPMFTTLSTKEDGVWQPLPVRGSDHELLYRTIVHPDAERGYAELFLFAFDLSQVSVHAVAGTVEPKSAATNAAVTRPGLVPSGERARLIAAFNGGFKAEHGQFGMLVDGAELLPPRPTACTFAALSDGSLRIAPWRELAGTQFDWWRQTPGCMIDQGQLHPGLRVADSRNWGATLDGKTVIRRSAVGLSPDGHTLFVGIGKSMTARALALGMQQAGANQVAQLDVNFSFPRLLLYRDGEKPGELRALGAVTDLLYEADEYVGRASPRDFFYVTLR